MRWRDDAGSARAPASEQEQDVGEFHGSVPIGVSFGIGRAKSAQNCEQIWEVHGPIAIQISSATLVIFIPQIK